MSDMITCPNCSMEIEVSAALSARMREQMSEEMAAERTRLTEEVRQKAEASHSLEMQDLQEQLNESRRKLADTQKAELQVRRERLELEEAKTELELNLSRQVDEQRQRIREDARNEVLEQTRLRDADKDKLIDDLRGQIDDLKRIAEQGSPQSRGEVMELVLEDFIRDSFPQDNVEPVPVSYHGGDVIQNVRDASGLDCGSILWESKRTKNWSDGWLPKLRDDQRAAKAHVAILATVEMPKGMTTFGYVDGVWVTNHHCLMGLAMAIRLGMIEAARTRRCAEGRQTKIEQLYQYLSSTQFRQRVEGIVESLLAMKEDLDSEKRSHQRMWAKRERHLERAVLNTATMHGDLGGIIGSGLPQIAQLEYAAIVAEGDDTVVENNGER